MIFELWSRFDAFPFEAKSPWHNKNWKSGGRRSKPHVNIPYRRKKAKKLAQKKARRKNRC